MEKAESGWKHWLAKQVETLYKENTEKFIRSKLKSDEIKKHISMLEATKENDAEYFWKDVCRPNLLAYLYLHIDVKNTKKAKELIQKSLEIEPTSVAALAINFQLAKAAKKSPEAKAVLEKLNSFEYSEDAKVLQIVAMAEVAYCLEYLGPRFYMLGIEKYEKSFSNLVILNEAEKMHPLITNKQCMWKFHLAQTYSRMMNRGNTVVLFSKRYDKDLHDVFQKTTGLLLEIIESEDPIYHGRALVELVDVYKKYETNGGDPRTLFPYRKGPDDCIQDAYNLCMPHKQKDAYVLERCGRHYRQRAKNEKDFLYAAKVLGEAVELCQTRHVAWHQLGLTYKSLWLNAGGHKESRLFTNKARRGKTKSRKRKFQQTGANNHTHECSETEQCTTDSFKSTNPNKNTQQRSQNPAGKSRATSVKIVDEPGCANNTTGANNHTHECSETEQCTTDSFKSTNPNKNTQQRSQNPAGKSRETSVKIVDEPDCANNTTFSRRSDIRELTNTSEPQRPSVPSGTNKQNVTAPPQPLPTILPRFPNPLGGTPRHQNKPDYLDKYRVSNPKVQQNGSTEKATEYFNKAIECLQKATELVHNTCCRYLVDLGRLYVSQNKVLEAEECFLWASNTEHNDNDAQYLYEQWALLWDKHPNEDSNGAEDIKDMYRRSIRSALKANVKSKTAFHNLRAKLEDEQKKNPEDKVTQKEIAILLCDMHKFKQAEEMLKNLLASLKNDPRKVEIVWQLTELYYRRGQRHDAAAAYTYLVALEKAGQLDINEDRIQMIIQLARKDFEEKETEMKLNSIRNLSLATTMSVQLAAAEKSPENESHCNNLMPHPYFKDVLRWLAGNKTLVEIGFQGKKDEKIDQAYNETDICLLAFDNIKSETVDSTASRLWKLLDGWCDLREGVSCLPDDIEFNHPCNQAAAAILSKTKAVAIVLDGRERETDEESEQHASLQEMIDKLKRLNLKNICFVVGENSDSEYCSQYNWPCFVLNQECTDCCIVSSFFQFLFRATNKKIVE